MMFRIYTSVRHSKKVKKKKLVFEKSTCFHWFQIIPVDEDDAEDDITTDQIKEAVTVGEEQIVASESKGGKCKSLVSEY